MGINEQAKDYFFKLGENPEPSAKSSAESHIEIDMENVKKGVEEYKKGERTLILKGLYREEDGFTLFPFRNDEIGIYLNKDTISREITLEEVQKMKDSPHCKNKEAIEAFLDLLESEKE